MADQLVICSHVRIYRSLKAVAARLHESNLYLCRRGDRSYAPLTSCVRRAMVLENVCAIGERKFAARYLGKDAITILS